MAANIRVKWENDKFQLQIVPYYGNKDYYFINGAVFYESKMKSETFEKLIQKKPSVKEEQKIIIDIIECLDEYDDFTRNKLNIFLRKYRLDTYQKAVKNATH